ncbi:MAG: response regulator transcription factor [Melioribacteraceae bacterium]|nr:response regulator transcription factor [Melioribacteraceae bacterium]MCF8265642.1 response regulator transcription factor [Melioribacteraceae bacterium]MCF8414275.1 response regulator transcription factor [Melioribacteraceae bacterium]
MKTKILLVDDEKDIVEFLSYNLEKEGFKVISAYNGQEALDKLVQNPDLIVLDIMMPKMDGYEVLKKIRNSKEYSHLPVIFLTAKSSEMDEIHGLEIGADDFIQKPISPSKLIARVKSNLRKVDGINSIGSKDLPVIEIGPIKIDKNKYTVHIDGESVVFPKKEFEILYYLINNPGKVLSRDKILNDVWGTEIFVVERTVDVHVRKIREKLDGNAFLIETVKGVGYRFKNVE